jgi:uncharacterized protein YggE
MEILNDQKGIVYKALAALLVVLTINLAVGIFTPFFRGGHDGGMNSADGTHTISLTGHGEVQAVPDIANVYFTISKDAKTVKDAQAAVATIENKAIESLKANGVAEADYKTTDSSFSPKYESKAYVPCTQYGCPPSAQTIVGYTANESITVKVRATDTVSKIMQDLGTLGVTNLSGPNFSIDDQDALTAEARKKAIDDAKTKAQALAKDLGVRLGDIISFSEGGNYPMAYAKTTMAMDSVGAMAPRAELPKGENTISSDVTITYEIK